MTRSTTFRRESVRVGTRAWLCLLVCAVALVPLLTAPAGAQAQGAERRFSLDFVATDMVDVIKALSAQSGANIALSGKVSGQVTLRLTDTTVEQALNVITKLNGLDYALLDNTYVVGTAEEVKGLTAAPPAPDQLMTKVVPLKYVSAEDATALLVNAEPQVKAIASPTGGLILTATPPVIERCATLIAGIDVATAVSVAARQIYAVKYADGNEMVATLKATFPNLAVIAAPRSATPTVSAGGQTTGATAMLTAPQLTTQSAGGAGASGGTADMSPVTRIVLSGAPATLARALKLCAELDQAPLQVKISATISEVRSDVESRLGINWSDLAGKASVTIGEAAPTDAETGLTDGELAPHDLAIGKIVRSHLNITGALNALVTEGKARILANPTVTILDGRQATIHAGEKVWYGQIVGRDTQGYIYQATEIDIGVTLKVSPRVGPDGDITLTLVPTISSITSSVFDGYPTITERSTVTTVRVRNGETLAIGGLKRDEETITINKVPVLGDLPLIGYLFKSKDRHPFHSEVVIVITPEIVKEKA